MSPPKSTPSRAGKLLIPGIYGPHPPSILSEDDITEIRGSCGIALEVKILIPSASESLENPPPGYCCAFVKFFSACGLPFPLPELIIQMMSELGFALPQMCPNFVRTVLYLQTLAEEHGYKLSLADFLHIYTVKTGRTKGTLYVSPLSGLKVFDDLPEKDENGRNFHFERGQLSPTFVEYFSWPCEGQIAWDSFSCERIRESGARLRSCSYILSTEPRFLDTSSMAYREEKAFRRDLENTKKEAKRLMSNSLAKGKAHIPAKSPDSCASKESGVPAPVSECGRAAGGSQQTELSKKRKEPETSSSSREKVRARTSSSGDGRSRSGSRDGVPPSEKKFGDPLQAKESGGPSSKLPPKEQRYSSRAPPPSPADLMRSFVRPGVRVLPFADMSEVNRRNFFRFTDRVGEMMIEFNNSIASYENQLFASPSVSEMTKLKDKVAELEIQVEEFTGLEAINAKTVEKAEQIRSRVKKAELQVLDLGIANEDLRGKLKKAGDLYYEAAESEKAAKNKLHVVKLRNQLLEASHSCEMEKVRREERQSMRRSLCSLIEDVRAHFEEREHLTPDLVRAAEIKANRMLIEQISKGEIADLEAELESILADEEKADGDVVKMSNQELEVIRANTPMADAPEVSLSELFLNVPEELTVSAVDHSSGPDLPSTS
ncbi:PREDICTED: uncharacterized protein At3g60930, chloroplastic-like [Camelina sativa]|uniref:Uncharacterized protein At3g60930, chloroplastic-like n=1 Tax=Camelina sativa TaxID=90675 RepID=A0ABM1QR53_CAMSA|nr:PREDICTED: uncharacterized protein At3g60930, chloroplastic-like [Camelina sativa]